MHTKTGPSLSTHYNIVLIGYRAVGKSSVGALVAELLDRPFVDLDALVEQEAGQTIPEIVKAAGWPEFRRREKAMVQRYASRSGQVLATGGGVVLDPDNVANLRAAGKLVWLQATPATIQARLGRDSQQTASRPGLTGKGTWDEVAEVLTAREPLYRAAADVNLEVDYETPASLARRLVALVRAWEQPNS